MTIISLLLNLDTGQELRFLLRMWKIIKTKSISKDWHLAIVTQNVGNYSLNIDTLELNELEIYLTDPRCFKEKCNNSAIILSCNTSDEVLSFVSYAKHIGVIPVLVGDLYKLRDHVTHCYDGYIIPFNQRSQITSLLLSLMDDHRRLNSMKYNLIYKYSRTI